MDSDQRIGRRSPGLHLCEACKGLRYGLAVTLSCLYRSCLPNLKEKCPTSTTPNSHHRINRASLISQIGALRSSFDLSFRRERRARAAAPQPRATLAFLAAAQSQRRWQLRSRPR